MKIKITVNKNHAVFSQHCIDNNLEAIRQAIQDGLDLSELWTWENYPLSIAIASNNVTLACLLVENGMPLYSNTVFSRQHSENDAEFKGGFVFGQIEEDASDAEICLELLKYAKDVNTPKSICSPLYNACRVNPWNVTPSLKAYVKKILEMGGDVDYPTGEYGTILHSIVTQRNTDLVCKLISLSKDLDNPGGYGNGECPPLYLAIYKGKLEAVEALAKSGANINFCMHSRKLSMLDYLIEYRDTSGNSFANEQGEVDRTIGLFLKLGAKTYKELNKEKTNGV